jgi:hypothetical protein
VNEDELVRLIADEHAWLNGHNAHDGPVHVDSEEFSEFVRPSEGKRRAEIDLAKLRATPYAQALDLGASRTDGAPLPVVLTGYHRAAVVFNTRRMPRERRPRQPPASGTRTGWEIRSPSSRQRTASPPDHSTSSARTSSASTPA